MPPWVSGSCALSKDIFWGCRNMVDGLARIFAPTVTQNRNVRRSKLRGRGASLAMPHARSRTPAPRSRTVFIDSARAQGLRELPSLDAITCELWQTWAQRDLFKLARALPGIPRNAISYRGLNRKRKNCTTEKLVQVLAQEVWSQRVVAAESKNDVAFLPADERPTDTAEPAVIATEPWRVRVVAKLKEVRPVWAHLLGEGPSYVVMGSSLEWLEKLDVSQEPARWERESAALCCAALIHLLTGMERSTEHGEEMRGRHWSSQADAVERAAVEHLGVGNIRAEIKKIALWMLNALPITGADVR